MAMGIAEVIPGVSGGTIAFITGIYEDLIGSIKAIGPDLLKAYKSNKWKGIAEAINIGFLIRLIGGMVIGLGIGVFGVTYLLEAFPVLLWSFFFGLIIASAVYIARQLDKWKIRHIILFLSGAVIAYCVTIFTPSSGIHELWFVAISGMIAISALILPGISGSFILVLMGMYTYIVPAVKDAIKTFAPEKLTILAAFAVGAIIGLATFSRILSWTFKNYRNLTLATLTGFMIGSLNKIWPWRTPTEWLTDANGSYILNDEGLRKVIKEENLSPFKFTEVTGDSHHLLLAIVLMIIGFVAVFVLDKVGSKKDSE